MILLFYKEMKRNTIVNYETGRDERMRTAGVREYWIVNPLKHTVTVYDFEFEKDTKQYSFDETIPVCIYKDFGINIAELLL